MMFSSKKKALITATLLMSTNSVVNAVGLEFVFFPSIPTRIENPLYRTMDAKCTIETQDAQNELVGVMKIKTASINNVHLNPGENVSILVKNGDIMHIIADFGSRIEMTNNGEGVVRAVCSIG
ncbi:hypothetical protein [Legionella shakespearei]|uniref:Uncharacterized protein n=1 Tax=Legionella shakespearei DSM 23087 TaxID=1122169 RepID=A0A0W0YU26_9GAMM|nr:hypothetical protein [Legionella shakespearei]KTD60038.1 hypothetical protein Lsha_1788 [Legionella shakespearei DSM 23087]